MTRVPAEAPLFSAGLLARRLAPCVALVGVATLLGLLLSSSGLELADADILWRMRAPRLAQALLAGAALAGAGVAFQALLANPLADPYIIGVSGGAALGGTLAIVLGGAALSVPLTAFGGALAASLGAYLFARRMGGSAYQILMTGVVVNAFAASAISFVKTVVSAATAQEILLWLIGSLGYPSWGELALSAAGVALGLTVLAALAPRYNALAFGDTGAAALGVDVALTRSLTFVAGSLVVGVVVAQVGMIGFVGLVVPHLLRLLWGPDHRLLLPAASLVGAAVVAPADALARLSFVLLDTTLPVGVITALLGGPFFVLLMARGRRSWSLARGW